MKDFKLEDKKEKLVLLKSKDEAIKIVWGWIKRNEINLQQFKELIIYIS